MVDTHASHVAMRSRCATTLHREVVESSLSVWGETIDISKTRSSLSVLQEWLTANEFWQTRSRSALVTSGDYTQWTSRTLRIEIQIDRGQWYLGLGVLAMPNTYHPDEWEAWLERRSLRYLSDLDHQVDFVTQRWMRAADLAVIDLATSEAELEAIGLDWVERRYGWRPA